MARRRSAKVKINTQLMIDVVSAGLIVRNLPKIIDMVVPLDPMLKTAAAVGGGYMTGVMLKRPNLANASIAVGIAQFVDPFVDQLLGGFVKPELIPQGANLPPGIIKPEPVGQPLDDYMVLNDYVNDPTIAMNYADYSNVY